MMLNKILRYITVVGVFALPVIIPFIVSSSMFFPFITGKGFTFRIVTEIVFGAWLLLALRDKNYRPKFSWILAAIGVFLGIMLVADIFAVNPLKALWSNFERMEGFVSIFHMALYFLVASSSLINEKFWSWTIFFRANILAGIVMSCYGFLQLAGKITINQGGVRLDGTFGNATYLAGYMLMMIFLALFVFVRDGDKTKGKLLYAVIGFVEVILVYFLIPRFALTNWLSGTPVSSSAFFNLAITIIVFILGITVFIIWKKKGSLMGWFYGLATSCYLIILYNTATRGALLGLIGGLLLSAILIAIFEKERKILRNVSIGIAVSVLIIAGVFFAIRDSKFVESHPSLARLTSISTDSADAQARFMVWGMALGGFKERPILGWGQEGFNFVFNKYYNPEMYGREQWFDRTHSILFDWLIAGGILGFLGYYSLLFFALLYIWGCKKLPESRFNFSVTEKALLTGFLASYWFQNVFVFDNVVSYILFFSFLAFLHSNRSRPIEKIESAVQVSESDMARFYTPIVVVVLIVVLWFVNGKNILAARGLVKALSAQPQGITQNLDYFKSAIALDSFANQEIREQLVQVAANIVNSNNTNFSADTKTQFVTLAVSEMKKQAAETPGDARAYAFLGSLYSLSGSPDDTINAFKEALKLSPKKQTIATSLASAYLSAGKTAEAVAVMKAAYDYDPKISNTVLTYAAILIYSGNNTTADEILKSKFGDDIPPDSRLIRAYSETRQTQKAINLAKKAVLQDSSLNNIQNLAAVYWAAGMKSSAISTLQTAINQYPSFKEEGESLIKGMEEGTIL